MSTLFLFLTIFIFLVQNSFAQVFGNGLGIGGLGQNGFGFGPSLGPGGIAAANLANGNLAGNFAGLGNNFPPNNFGTNALAGNIGMPLGGVPFSSSGPVNYGDVSVIGELPVAGNTLVNGNVPVIGYVTFEGIVPAGGLVSVANGCGCNSY